MKTYAPDYYGEFKCIASECRHNCCIGWEIDIDRHTLEYYRSIGGRLGERLKQSISKDECPHFILGKDERCPFLGRDNLCDIIRELGEDALCDICSDHPRYRSFFASREEIGTGLACEASARLIVTKEKKTVLIPIEDDNTAMEMEDIPAEESEFFALRNSAFDILSDRTKGIGERLSAFLELCGSRQTDINAANYLPILSKLECMQKEWQELLCDISECDFPMELPRCFDTPFEQLAIYFVFRHLSKSLDGYDLGSVAAFCVFSTKMIMLLCAYHLYTYGELTFDDIAEAARMFSCEIEYSEENTDTLIDTDICGRRA